jgi:hypothetical protein
MNLKPTILLGFPTLGLSALGSEPLSKLLMLATVPDTPTQSGHEIHKISCSEIFISNTKLAL